MKNKNTIHLYIVLQTKTFKQLSLDYLSTVLRSSNLNLNGSTGIFIKMMKYIYVMMKYIYIGSQRAVH